MPEWLPFPLLGYLPDPGIEPGSPVLWVDFTERAAREAAGQQQSGGAGVVCEEKSSSGWWIFWRLSALPFFLFF